MNDNVNKNDFSNLSLHIGEDYLDIEFEHCGRDYVGFRSDFPDGVTIEAAKFIVHACKWYGQMLKAHQLIGNLAAVSAEECKDVESLRRYMLEIADASRTMLEVIKEK